MADFESNIRIGIDNSQALEALKALQREISTFQTSMARGTAAQAAAASKYQQELVSSINATGKFSANIKSIQTTTEAFTTSLEKNKLSFGQYFRYAAASTKTFGNSFRNELEVINKTARERVKDLQTQYIKLGRDASGAMQAIAVRPLALDLQDYGTKTAIAAQKQQILNQLLKQGSTNLLNFGKNTQWAGRQLMVGFTIPLSIFGSTAARSFMELEEQVIKFRKVYGDLFTTGPEREEALSAIKDLANGFTQYGIAVSDTVGIAAEAAAAGFAGLDLQRQTQQSIRLSVLGQLEQQKALETTISLQNAFRLSSDDLAESIDFLNAVENQTVVSLDDITTAIPKVAPVIQSLGGDVKDLAFFLAAMKEGGVNASEGANALKSGLASLINPTDKAAQMLAGFGINIRDIVTRNAGNLRQTVLDFALALDQLDPLARAQAIEQLFGKFQFARISTLFDNVIKDGSQASRVLDLATASAGDLAQMSEKELGMTAASAMMQFRKAIEDLQVALAPIGELFLEIVTPLINFAADVLKNFNNLDEGVKKFIGGLIGLLGAVGPVAIMTFGLLANGIANIIKGFLAVRNVFANFGKSTATLGEQVEYMTQKQLQELAVAASLEQAHMNLSQAFTSEALAIDKLVGAYDRAILKQRQFMGAGAPTTIGQAASKFANGGVVGGTGNGDTVPAMLTPGEFVVKKDRAKLFMPLLEAMNNGKIPGFQNGGEVGGNNQRYAGKMMILPGGAQLGHFSEASERTGEELLKLAEEFGATNRELAKLRAMVGDNLSDTFKVFDSRVERVSEELNQMVGDVGTGKTAPKSIVQRDLVERGRDARMPIIDRMMKAGIAPEDALSKADKITQEIKTKMDMLGDEVKFTAEDINKLTQEAYETVAKTDADIEAAYEEMKKIQTYTDPTTVRGGRGQRESFGTGYIKQRERIKRNAPALGATAYGASAFKTTQEMEEISGLSGKDIQQKFKALSDRQKIVVYSELKKGTTEFIQALLKASSDAVVDGVKTSTKQASPSKEAFDAGKNIGVGGVDGIESQIDDAKVAGTKVGSAAVAGVTQSEKTRTFRVGPRRVTTDPNVYAANAGPRIFGPANDASAILRDKLNPVIEETRTRFDSINNTALKLSFGFSSVATLASMFGAEVGEATNFMYGLSNALMALTAVVEIARITNLKEAASRAGLSLTDFITGAPKRLAGRFAGAKGAAGVEKIFTGGAKNSFQNLIKVANGLGGTLGKVSAGFLRFLPVIGAAITAFTIFQMISEAQENQRKKIEGLGNAANATADQLKYLADATGTQIQESGFGEGYRPTGSTGVDVTQEARSAIDVLREDSEEFKKQFEDVLFALANATPQAGEAALANLALQLDAKGFAPDVIAGIIEALKEESGKKELDLSFIKINAEGKLDLNSIKQTAAEAFTIVQEQFSASQAKTVGGAFSFGALPPQTAPGTANTSGTVTSVGGYSLAGTTAAADADLMAKIQLAAGAATSQIQSLNKQFTLGLMTVTDYNTQFDEILSGITALDPAIRGLAIDEIAAQWPEFAEQIKGVTDQGDKLLLLEAQVKGIKFDDTDIQELIKNGPKANSIRQRLTRETNNAAKASEEARKAEEARAKATQAGLDLQGFDAEIERNRQILEDAPALVEAGLNEAEAIKALTDEKWNNIFATAKQKDLEENTNKYTQEAIGAYKEYQSSVEGVNNAMAAGDMAAQITELQKQNDVLAWLTQNGMSTAKALEVIGNSTYYAAAAANMAKGTYKDFADQLKQIETLSAPLSTPTGGGQKSDFQQAIENLQEQKKEAINLSVTYTKLKNAKLSANQAFTAAKDPIIAAAVATTQVGTEKWAKLVRLIREADSAIRRSKLVELFAQRQADNVLLSTFTKITPLLSRMGLSLGDINDILSDPAIAQAFIDDLKDGKINSQQILDIINQIPTSKRIQVAFDMATPEGMMSVFDEAFDRQMDFFDLQERNTNRQFAAQEKSAQAGIDAAQEKIDTIQKGIEDIETRIENKQRQIELTIDRPIEALNESIASIEREIELNFDRPIAALQETSSDLSNELELMDRAAEDINNRFDAQASALEKINELNAEIVAQDNERLEVADALAAGNIADAISAMRKARQEEQKRARERAAKAIEIARENELSKIRSASGLTREQIEQRQFEISQQIFSLEEQREVKQSEIQDIQDQIYAIEQKRKPLLAEIRDLEDQIYRITTTELKEAENVLKVAEDKLKAIQDSKQAKLDEIDAQRLEWEQLRDQAQDAMLKSDGYLTSLTNAKNMVDQIKKAWEAVGTVTPNSVANIVPAPTPKPTPTTTTTTTTTTDNAGPGPMPPYSPGAGKTWKVVNNKWTAVDLPNPGPMPPYSPGAGKKWQLVGNKWTAVSIQTSSRPTVPQPSRLALGGMVSKYASGGIVKYMADGGMFSSLGTDTVPAMLTPGEFVVSRFGVEKFGSDNLKAVNNGTYSGNSVYNYEVNVNVKSDANPDQIARSVISQIKQIDSQRIRGNRF